VFGQSSFDALLGQCFLIFLSFIHSHLLSSESLEWLVVLYEHVTNDLCRDFLEDLLGKYVSFGSRVLLELDELDDVALGCATVLVTQETAIRIKLLHQLELLFADTDDDD
jgi:hypothetical protein